MASPRVSGTLTTVYILIAITRPTNGCLKRGNSYFTFGKSDMVASVTNRLEEPASRENVLQSSTSSSKISVNRQWMVDSYGRVRLFHGWNSVQKGVPWYTEEMINETKLDLYKSWGFNVVRLGCMWSGFEPTEGWYNETYIGIMKDIVKRLEQRGIYVIMDMHQDLMSTMFGNYDGIPLWILKKFPPSPHRYPWPFRRGHFMTWTDGYLSQAIGVAFQHLYNNYGHALDRMARFWSKVATVFKDSANVLGYELINEPWAGDIYSRPFLLEPGNAGRINLAPAYDKISNAIRLVDDRTLIFYEPVTWGIFLNGEHAGSGFDRVPGGPKYSNRSVLAYHYYCWLMDVSQQHRPFTFLQRTICDQIVGPKVFPAVLRDIARTKGSSFLTEFGACEPDGHANSSATVECDFVMRLADQFLASWTYWDHAFFDEGGHVNWNVAGSFARVYARAVSGTPRAMQYNVSDYNFFFSYQPDRKISQPTEIVIPEMHYRTGFQVRTSAGTKWTFDEKERIVKVYAENNTKQTLITVVINRNSDHRN
ncbi:hypothetical protein LSH36_115g13038 [Paralvinella palmiformis]|uniref:Endoglycoceramidase n=1 Tax=Paralvinella palmiformis TaxID=53620 RepID=A0AAD9JYR8_9ANNE|nr:hypothetical protein LSH36_115g13038 [Paralvinella palmiformis]